MPDSHDVFHGLWLQSTAGWDTRLKVDRDDSHDEFCLTDAVIQN
jgi:hypothetical protein